MGKKSIFKGNDEDKTIIDSDTLNFDNFDNIVGGCGENSKKCKCINWECKECLRKATDSFYVGGMHNEDCKYRGIIGCKSCKHYVKGVRCSLASSGEN